MNREIITEEVVVITEEVVVISEAVVITEAIEAIET